MDPGAPQFGFKELGTRDGGEEIEDDAEADGRQKIAIRDSRIAAG